MAKKLIILDLDGTLYNFRGGSFSKSDLKKRVLLNAKVFIKSKLKETAREANKILKAIITQYGEHISVGLEKEYGIDRMQYFNYVWNIDPEGLVKPNPGLRRLILKLVKNGYEIIIVSDAPNVWIRNVLNYLDLVHLFKGKVFSGESDNRKGFGNVFDGLIKNLNYRVEDCIIIGDQEQTDIIPAKRLGAKTIFVNQQKKSKFADYNIKSIFEIKKVLGV